MGRKESGWIGLGGRDGCDTWAELASKTWSASKSVRKWRLRL